jgi:hypothetical protein
MDRAACIAFLGTDLMKRATLLFVVMLVALVAVVHGYIFLQYGDARPCQAATRAMVKAGFSVSAPVPTNPIKCYRIALRGVDEDTIQDSREDRPRMREQIERKQER